VDQKPNYGDERKYLSFWGMDTENDPRYRGGCCRGQFNATDANDDWGQAFTMAYAVDPAVEFHTFLFTKLEASTQVNASFWELHCTGVPVEAVKVKVQMGGGGVPMYVVPTDGGPDLCSLLVTNYLTGSSDKLTTFSYMIKAPAQPATPPKTSTRVVFFGDTETGDYVWSNLCQQIPPNTLYMVLTMVDVKDYFRCVLIACSSPLA